MTRGQVILQTPLSASHVDPGDSVNVKLDGEVACTIMVGEGTSEAKLVGTEVTTTVSNRLTPMEIYKRLAEAALKRRYR